MQRHRKAKEQVKRNKDIKDAKNERLIGEIINEHLSKSNFSKDSVSTLSRNFSKNKIRCFYMHWCGGTQSNVSRSKIRDYRVQTLVDEIERSDYIRGKRNEPLANTRTRYRRNNPSIKVESEKPETHTI